MGAILFGNRIGTDTKLHSRVYECVKLTDDAASKPTRHSYKLRPHIISVIRRSLDVVNIHAKIWKHRFHFMNRSPYTWKDVIKFEGIAVFNKIIEFLFIGDQKKSDSYEEVAPSILFGCEKWFRLIFTWCC